MPTWLLLLLIFAVWCVWVLVCVLGNAVKDCQDPLLYGARRGFSAFPGIPILPVCFWLVAEGIDAFASPWGSYSVLALHALLLAMMLITIVADARRLKKLSDRSERT